MSVAAIKVPWGVRVQLGHAAIQVAAERCGADLLHIKGYALDETLMWQGRSGSDVDVLVRPAHVDGLVSALEKGGWRRTMSFEAGSPFGHLLSLRHDDWGNADVHRLFPGLGPDPAVVFDVLWRDREARRIAGVDCPVPSLAAQALVLMTHAARSRNNPRAQSDVEVVWGDASAQRRADIAALVAELGAEVAFAAAIGDLDQYRDRPDYLLWKVVSQGGTRLEEWRARVRAAGSPAAAVVVMLQAPLVNVEHLAALLGRPPTRVEIVKEFFARPLRGLREQVRARWPKDES